MLVKKITVLGATLSTLAFLNVTNAQEPFPVSQYQYTVQMDDPRENEYVQLGMTLGFDLIGAGISTIPSPMAGSFGKFVSSGLRIVSLLGIDNKPDEGTEIILAQFKEVFEKLDQINHELRLISDKISSVYASSEKLFVKIDLAAAKTALNSLRYKFEEFNRFVKLRKNGELTKYTDADYAQLYKLINDSSGNAGLYKEQLIVQAREYADKVYTILDTVANENRMYNLKLSSPGYTAYPVVAQSNMSDIGALKANAEFLLDLYYSAKDVLFQADLTQRVIYAGAPEDKKLLIKPSLFDQDYDKVNLKAYKLFYHNMPGAITIKRNADNKTYMYASTLMTPNYYDKINKRLGKRVNSRSDLIKSYVAPADGVNDYSYLNLNKAQVDWQIGDYAAVDFLREAYVKQKDYPISNSLLRDICAQDPYQGFYNFIAELGLKGAPDLFAKKLAPGYLLTWNQDKETRTGFRNVQHINMHEAAVKGISDDIYTYKPAIINHKLDYHYGTSGELANLGAANTTTFSLPHNDYEYNGNHVTTSTILTNVTPLLSCEPSMQNGVSFISASYSDALKQVSCSYSNNTSYIIGNIIPLIDSSVLNFVKNPPKSKWEQDSSGQRCDSLNSSSCPFVGIVG